MRAFEEHKVSVTCSEKFNVYYRIYNPELLKKRVPLICVHHLVGNCSDYDFLATAVTDFAVITPDIPGRGRSDWLSDASLYNYDTYCKSIMQLLHHLEVREFAFLGASMGGIIGMRLVEHCPKGMSHLILNDVGPYMEKRSLTQVLRYLESYTTFENLEDARHYLKTWFAYFGIDREEFWDHVVLNYVTKVNGEYRLTYDPAIGPVLARQVEEGGMIMDMWSTWEEIRCRILVLHGARSTILTAATLNRMLQSKSDIKAIDYPNVGHLPALYPKNRIDDVLNWLQDG